jgi:hypothetical protein
MALGAIIDLPIPSSKSYEEITLSGTVSGFGVINSEFALLPISGFITTVPENNKAGIYFTFDYFGLMNQEISIENFNFLVSFNLTYDL